MLRPFFYKIFKFNWSFGLLLIFALGIPRFILVLQANVTGKFNYVSIIFLIMWALPFVFLTKTGRKYIGLKKPTRKIWLLYAFVLGALTSLLVYGIGFLLYNYTLHNWFAYLARPFEMYGTLPEADKLILFIVSAIIAMTFSPIGEEFFYRGLVHGSFQTDVGDTKASYIDSLAFALTHLAHFGIVFINEQWQFLFIPALLWVLLMFFTSRLFFWCKQRSGSLLGAVLSHAGFNLMMMYIIFYHIL